MKQIGRYQVIRRLGKGGMGAVYKGIAPVIEKVVAIKLLEPAEVMEDILGFDLLCEIFTFEAKTMASFQHPFLVTAYDFDVDEKGRPFFVMEYICKNLGEMIGEEFQVEKESRIINPQKVLHYGSQVLKALAFLHHENIIHRDVKPQNILVTDEDTIKICDFGMALVEGTSFSGPENMQIGSPYYTPPEQRKDPLRVDGRADLYSTAVLLYRMLTGKLPGMQSFSLSQVNPLYDSTWDDFFSKALSWNPDDRYATADEMLDALKQLHLHTESNTQISKEADCVFDPAAGLRSEPVNVCKSRAAKAFGVNNKYRPAGMIKHCREVRGKLVVDTAAGVAWAKEPSRFPLSRQRAFEYVEGLNRSHAHGFGNWRVPTVNELLSLLGLEDYSDWFDFMQSGAVWLWSCDLHGNHEGWYVNLDMGYTGVQDINCLNYVLPVCTIAASP